MGGAASYSKKVGTKYMESSKQNRPRRQYEQETLEGSGPGTFESTQASKQVVSSELEQYEGPKVANPRAHTTYRSKSPAATPRGSQAPSVRGDSKETAAGSESPTRSPSRLHSRPASIAGDEAPTGAQSTPGLLSPSINVTKVPTQNSDAESPTRGVRPSVRHGTNDSGQQALSPKSPAMRSNDRNGTKESNKGGLLPKIGAAPGNSRGPRPSVISRLEIVEVDNATAGADVSEDFGGGGGGRSQKRRMTTGLHQNHSAARQSILDARTGGGGDPMGGLSVGMKVIGQGAASEMGVGVVLKAANTPGMVIVRMDQSGKEMTLPVGRLRGLNDDKMVKAAEKLVNRVPNRASVRHSTFG